MSDSSELDLAGLVCNETGDDSCINPKKGQTGGMTWADRMKALEKFEAERER